MPKSKSKRRYTKLDIAFVSLCPQGKNGLPVVMKAASSESDHPMLTIGTVAKATPEFDETGEILALVYVPDVPDSDGDMASAQVIKEACNSFAKNGMNLDIRHNNMPISKDRAYVAQSFIVQKGDTRFDDVKLSDGTSVDPDGGWALSIKLEDSELRGLYKDKGWQGVSMFGYGTTEEVAKSEQEDSALMQWLRKAWNDHRPNKGTQEGEDSMTDQEKKDFAELVATSTATAVAKALKPDTGDVEGKDADKAGDTAKKEDKTVDLTDPKAVKEHIKQLKLKKAIEGLDLNDPEALEKHLKTLEAEAEEKDETHVETPGSIQKGKGSSEFTSYAEQDKVMKEFEDLAEAALGKA